MYVVQVRNSIRMPLSVQSFDSILPAEEAFLTAANGERLNGAVDVVLRVVRPGRAKRTLRSYVWGAPIPKSIPKPGRPKTKLTDDTPKRKPGRPRIKPIPEPKPLRAMLDTRAKTVTLDKVTVTKAKLLGGGNLSAGLRKAIELLPESLFPFAE